MRKAGDIAHSLISESGFEVSYRDVFLKWREIVGDELSASVDPHKIVKMNKKNLLIVKSRGKCPVELQHDSLKIIKSLNKYFGIELFSVIRVIQK